MSMLILPRRFSAETASVDWSNPIAARFSAISVPLAGGLSRNFARPGGKPVQTYGVSTGTSIKVAAGLGGMGIDGTAITTQSHWLHSVANATNTAWEEPLAAATWFAVLVRRGNNANGKAPIFINGSPSTAPYNAYAILDSDGSGTAVVECSAGNASRSATAGAMSNNKLTVIVGRYTGYKLAGFLDGVKYGSEADCTGNLVYVNAANRGPSVGNFYDYGTARSFNGQIYLVGVAPVALSDAEIVALSADPWQLLAAPDDIIWLDAGGGGVTGSFAATESGSDTAAFSGAILVSGGFAATESGADAAALVGQVHVAGTLAASESGADTAAFLGSGAAPPIYGAFDILESGADGFALSGKVIVAGGLAASESGGDAATFAGGVGVSGALAASETGTDSAAFLGDTANPGVSGALAAAETGGDTAFFTNTVPTSKPGYIADDTYRSFSSDDPLRVFATDDLAGGMHMAHRFPPIEVEEKVPLTFRFGAELTEMGATLTSISSVEVAVRNGVADASPSSLVTTSNISGTGVIVAADGRTPGADFELRVTCATSNPYLVLTRVGYLQVNG